MTDFRDPIQQAIEEAIKPISKPVDKVVGPAAREIGLTLGDAVGIFHDSVREYREKRSLYRYARQMELWKKVQRMIGTAGFEPKPVEPRLLIQAIDSASIEGDDSLQSMWAALIANAADPRRSSPVQTYFPEFLRQLTKDQAQLLQRMYEHEGEFPIKLIVVSPYDGNPRAIGAWNSLGLRALYFGIAEDRDPNEKSGDSHQFEIALENLLRLGLITDYLEAEVDEDGLSVPISAIGNPEQTSEWMRRWSVDNNPHRYYLSTTGRDFVEACTAPTPRSVRNESGDQTKTNR